MSKPFLHIFPLASETLSPEAAAATFDVRSGKFPPIRQHNTRLALPTNQPTNQLLTAGSLSHLGFIVLPVAPLVTSGDEIVLKSEHLMEINLFYP